MRDNSVARVEDFSGPLKYSSLSYVNQSPCFKFSLFLHGAIDVGVLFYLKTFIYFVRYGKEKGVFHSKNVPPCTGQIPSTCAVLQDACAPMLLERVRSGHDEQGEAIVLKRPLESVLVELKDFRASFSTVFVSKLR